MSLDIYAVIDTGGPEPAELGHRNITHNASRQIAAAGADPWEYEGRPVADTIPELRACLAALSGPTREAEFRRLDAPNGWGLLEDSIEFVRDVLAMAEAHPKARWRVSR